MASTAIVSRRGVPEWLTAPLLIGALVVLFWVVVACTVDFWAPFDPLALAGRRLQPPSTTNLLGTDALGRDVLTRTLYGVQHSLPVALSVVTIAVAIGSLLGGIPALPAVSWARSLCALSTSPCRFRPCCLQWRWRRPSDRGSAMPPLRWFSSGGPSMPASCAARCSKCVSASMSRPPSPAGQSVRASSLRISSRCAGPPLLINATMDFGQVVLLAASLSFIGLGATPPTPEWGSMVSDGAVHFYQWWIAFGPGFAILTVVLGFNFLGDGLRDMLDPRTQ